MGLDIFRFNVRYSVQVDDGFGAADKPVVENKRWDKYWLKDELTMPGVGVVAKVFVCGAPIMNQTFDKALEDIAPKLNLSWKDIELL